MNNTFDWIYASIRRSGLVYLWNLPTNFTGVLRQSLKIGLFREAKHDCLEKALPLSSLQGRIELLFHDIGYKEPHVDKNQIYNIAYNNDKVKDKFTAFIFS